jgi:hypothetical protein
MPAAAAAGLGRHGRHAPRSHFHSPLLLTSHLSHLFTLSLSLLHQQGVMLDIVAMILIVVEENLPFGVLWTPWSDLFYACMFWFVFLLVVYCLFFCFL